MTNPADKLSLLMATPNEEPISQYKGIVQQTDDSKAYVLIDGGTAVWCDTMDVKALVGDRVRVEVRKHKGTLVANYTHPVTDDAVANAADSKATEALGKVETLEVDALKADSAVIRNLQADTAKVHDLTADQLSAATAYVGELTAGEVTAQSIIADKAKLAQVDTDQLHADHAVIETLDSTYASIDNLNAATARIGSIEADYLVAADMTAEQARVGQLMAGKADVADLTAANARIDNLQSTKADISVLESDYITADAIDATYLHADMSNADVAWIQNGVIKDGSISNAMINDVSANKLTAGTINGSVINVTNLNADNITAGTINGQRIGEGSLSLDKLSEDVYTEQEVDSKLATMQAEIDGAIETWTGTAVPTLNNSPASNWTTAAVRDTHVGDVYFVVNSQSEQNGYNYRFTKSGSTYSWQLIKDSDVTNALQRLSTAEGKITTFDSDISTLKTDTGTLKTKTESLETRMSDAEDDILDKVDTTTFNEVSDTVDQHSQSITQMSQTLSNKADGSTVTALTTRVSKNEQDITGINTTIGELSTTVESKADSSTVESVSNRLNTVSDTVDGHTQSISSINSTLETKADSSTVSSLTTKVNTVSDTVDGHTQTIGSVQTTQTQMQGKLDKTIVETTQLWYSKSSTDAPSKPTSQVTSTSTAGNAWRTVVPAYNASYPNYFYCYQWKYTDGTYGWSGVTRDIAMGESQERARTAITNAAAADTKAGNAATAAATAQTTADTAKSTADTAKATADKNVKSTLQLWYTKANDTAPSKPTSKVTSTSVSGNAWRTVVPTYSASYPYYFYCYQYELADGTCTWSDVVYDRATTENQSNSRSAVADVSTLTTKTNTISDTVDGHTSQLSSITSTQTSIQGSAVKSTVQLWYTKANTTAPNKPTAHVTTNNASTANAWNLAVPTYNASYPNYFYCYEYQYLNDTYGWSAVTRDIATGEAQSTARTAASDASSAVSTANTANTNASNAVSTANTANTNASNAVSTANTAASDASTAKTNAAAAVSTANTANTNASSAVTTANTAKSTADKNLRESQQLWFTKANSTAPSKPTSKVTSTATTGNAWTTRVPTYSDSYKYYFYCMQYVAADGTVTWSDVIYDQATTEAQSVARAASADLTEFHQEYATFKQTTQEFESTVGETYATKTALKETDDKIENLDVGGRNRILNTLNPSASKLPTPVGLSWGGPTGGTVEFLDGVTKFTSTSTSGEHFIRLNTPSSTSHALESMGIPYPCDMVLSGYYKCSFSDSAARLTVRVQNSNGTSWLNQLPLTNLLTGRVEEGGIIQINTSSSVDEWSRFEVKITVPEGVVVASAYFSFQYYATPFATGDTFEIKLMKLEKGNKATDWSPAPEDADSQLSSIEERVSTAETSIAQNKNDILLKANSSDVYTKQESDGLISTEVTNRNAAIQVSANAINQNVSENYTTKTEFNNLEIGGRNLLLAKPSSYKQTSYDAYVIPSSTSATELGAGTTLTIQFWDVELDSNSSGIGGYWGGGSSGQLFIVNPDANGYCSKTFTISAATASHAQGANKFLALYNLYGGHSGMSLSIGKWKLEKGNKGTDWTPAPEDLDAHFESVETAIKQNSDAIKLTATKEEVEKTYSTKEESQLDRAGSGISVLTDGAANAALKGLHVLGESVQDGTPTPSVPVEIRSVGLGENLLTDASVVDTTYYAKDSEGYYNINNNNWAWAYARSCVRVELPVGVYVVSMFLKEEETNANSHFMAYASNGSQLISHNLMNAGTIVHQRFVITGDFVVGFEFKLYSTSNRVTFRVMRVESAALVSQDDAIDIRTHGRNLLTSTEDMSGNVKNTSAGSTYSYSGDTVTWTTTSTGWPYFLLTREAIPLCVLSESDTMTLSVDLRCTSGGGKTYLQIATVGSYAKPTPRIRMTNDTCTVGGAQIVNPTSSWTRYTFTVKTDLSTWNRQGSDSDNGIGLAAYLYYNDTGTIEVRHPQLELGSESTEYEPYSGTVTPIPLNGHELRSLPDGTRDELAVDMDGHVTMTQRVGSVTLDGSETWTMVAKASSLPNYAGSYWGFTPSPSDASEKIIGGIEALSNRYAIPHPKALSGYTDNEAGINNINISSVNRIFVMDSTLTSSASDFEAVLASSPMEMTYLLATPQTIDLGTIDMPQVHDGDTVEVIAALTPSIDATWWASAGQAVVDAYASLSSAIEVRAESIVSTVSERYATSQQVQAISSQIEQTAQGWTAQFNELTGGADLSMTLAQAFDALGVTSRNLEEIRSFVRITTDDAGDPLLLMGSATSPIMLALSNDSLRFMHGPDPVAYIDVDGTTNEGRLHITRAVVVKELQFGSWKWFERDGVGNLALKWVGDE